MFRDVNVLKLLPDRPGRGGTKFGYHSWQQEPINDTRQTLNVHVWQDSWRSDYASLASPYGFNFEDNDMKDPGEAASLALHGYSKFSLTSPTAGPVTVLLGHNITSLGGVPFGYVWNYTDYTDGTYTPPLGPSVPGYWTGTTNRVCWASYTHPAVFLNINNRCFIATGENEGMIYDATQTNDFQTEGPAKAYTIGVGSPQAAPVVAASDVIKTAEAYLHYTSTFISHPDPGGALAAAVEAAGDPYTVVGDGTKWYPGGGTGVSLVVGSKTTIFSSSLMTVSIPNGSQIATMAPTLSIPPDNEWVGLKLTVNGLEFVMMQFGNATGDDPALGLTNSQVYLDRPYENGSLPDDPSGGSGGWDPATDIVAQPFEVTGVRFRMRNGGVDVSWPLGASGARTIVGQLVDTGGLLTWDTTPPSYAYAWYDPTTGHISNISPIFSPDSTSETAVGIQVKVDVGDISYPPTTSTIGGSRWTHILFFRTLMAGGSTLYPIGSLDPYSVGWQGLPNNVITSIPRRASTNYWYDSARDATLLISGALRAPQFTNGKPQIVQNGVATTLSPAHMAYWDGRLWMAATQDPAALHYSCDRVQCPFGIPEESFPDTNVLRIPAADGAVRGMRLIGEQLLVTTERWAYTVAGNNESNYRLVRVSTRMAGVGDYQMDEFVSDVEGGGPIVVFVGTDAKIYAMPLGGQAVWISKEIQTYLDSSRLHLRTNYRLLRVHCMTVSGMRMVLVYIPSVSSTGAAIPGKTFVYNFDQKTWTEHTLQNDNSDANSGIGVSWATVSNQQDYVSELYSMKNTDTTPPISPVPLVKVRQWFAPGTTATRPLPSGYIRTFPLTLDGKKTRKQIHFVRIFVNDPSFTSVNPSTGVTKYPWRCTVQADSATAGAPLAFVTPLDPVFNSLSGGFPVDASTAAERIVTGPMLTGGPPLIGYTFDLTVYFPDQIDKIYQLYRVDVGWTTVSEEDP